MLMAEMEELKAAANEASEKLKRLNALEDMLQGIFAHVYLHAKFRGKTLNVSLHEPTDVYVGI